MGYVKQMIFILNSWNGVKIFGGMSVLSLIYSHVQGGSNMTGTNCDLFTHKSSRSYLNHLVVSMWVTVYYVVQLLFPSCVLLFVMFNYSFCFFFYSVYVWFLVLCVLLSILSVLYIVSPYVHGCLFSICVQVFALCYVLFTDHCHPTSVNKHISSTFTMWFPTRSANNVFTTPFLRATNNFKNTNFMAQDSTRLDTRGRDNHTHAWHPTFCTASLIILQMQRKKNRPNLNFSSLDISYMRHYQF
jgi:hypothetical protein